MANILKGKKIVLGITGSIAAYKACYIIRGLIKRGAEVQVVITPAGKEFITPITLSALTSKPVISEFFAQRDGTWNSHVDLGLWADAMLIAPATASTIGKMANGVADNMLITTYLSAKAPVFVAPAMDLDMYAHPSTQKNLDTLRSYGNHIIEPATGELASHLVGKGRMEEPENIIRHLEMYFAAKDGDLVGKTVMITAGPTYEKIDPVRFIGNYSSGKMGYALAKAAMLRGADVTLVSGPCAIEPPPFVKLVPVVTAKEMFDAVTSVSFEQDIIIKAAAVADYRPANVYEDKVKKHEEQMSIKLEKTDDILGYLGEHRLPGQFLCGFSMETQNMLGNSRAKLGKKHLDMVAANNLKVAGAGFQGDTNVLTLITQDEDVSLQLMSKEDAANVILDKILSIQKEREEQ